MATTVSDISNGGIPLNQSGMLRTGGAKAASNTSAQQ
jgi:hypothetical protein